MSAITKREINAISSVSDALSATFAALADPTRRAMLVRLSLGEASVNELAAPFKMSLPAVSKHIKVLEKAGLLTKTRSAQQRPCKIDGVQLKQAIDWIDQFASKTIAKKSTNTSATDKKVLKKQAKTVAAPENVPKKPKFKLKLKPETSHVPQPPQAPQAPSTKENKNDNSLQQQIGFDF
jgi:DNA-binding transcriptional ArsR family regulator